MKKNKMKKILKNSIGYGLIVGVIFSGITLFANLVGLAGDSSINILISATLLAFLISFIPTFIISLLILMISSYFLK